MVANLEVIGFFSNKPHISTENMAISLAYAMAMKIANAKTIAMLITKII